MIASGIVISLSSGLRIVFRTPNTAAAASSAPALDTVTWLRTAATTPSTSALVSHEMPSLTSSPGPSVSREALRLAISHDLTLLVIAALMLADTGRAVDNRDCTLRW